MPDRPFVCPFVYALLALNSKTKSVKKTKICANFPRAGVTWAYILFSFISAITIVISGHYVCNKQNEYKVNSRKARNYTLSLEYSCHIFYDNLGKRRSILIILNNNLNNNLFLIISSLGRFSWFGFLTAILIVLFFIWSVCLSVCLSVSTHYCVNIDCQNSNTFTFIEKPRKAAIKPTM